MIINDHVMYKKRHLSLGLTTNDAKFMVNLVDAMYKDQLNTRIVLVAMKTWTTNDKVPVSRNPRKTLHYFMQYAAQFEHGYYDLIHLLSGLTFESTHSSAGYFGGVCSQSRGGAVNEYGNTATMAITLAQSIAQNIGMLWHGGSRDKESCSCEDSWNGCIMEDTGHQLPLQFSQCSLDEFQQFLRKGGGWCLFNKPSQLFKPPDCGNGFMEPGEECDCGSPAECAKAWGECCKGCTLTEGAVCAEGLCCSKSCQFVSTGEECRSPVNDCDMPEVCTGTSGLCPSNIHKQDGYACGTDGRCFGGECKYRDKQCKDIWGEMASAADELCYSKLNQEGTHKGNCGHNGDSWLQCIKKDVFCGLLLCTNIGSRPQLGILSGKVTRTSLRERGRLLQCSGANVILEDGSDLGYVPDGMPCDINAVCLERRCLPLDALNLTTCPSINHKTCSGHGVCSHIGQCVCSREWTGSDCSSLNPLASIKNTHPHDDDTSGTMKNLK
uniref:ADAM metallopeptidase domain 22 n=1 Tax=Eptatretus burgeri TaxID=7764 RepID=A0A8C4QPZ6_EPTBU